MCGKSVWAEGMEFRLFFPLLVPSDEWLGAPLREEYERCYHRLKDSLLEEIGPRAVASPENRCDSYYVGGDSVGVKLRVRDQEYLRGYIFQSFVRLGRKWKLK